MRSFAIAAMSWVAVSLCYLVPAIAQVPDPPATENTETRTPESQSDQLATPQAPAPSVEIPGLSGPEDAVQEDEGDGADDQREDVQPLTRGPVHEAFAEQVNLDPRATLVIPNRPPNPVSELPPEIEPEGKNVRWIAGYWAWDDEQEDFIWVSGLWRNVPPGRRWVPGDWVEIEGEYRWIQGTWAPEDATELSVRDLPPDSLEQGPNSEAPSDQHIWIPGCWVENDGENLWRAGFWTRGQDDWIWVPERYLWRPAGCIFVPGYWDYPVVHRGILFAPCRFSRPVYTHVDYRYSPSVVLNLGHIFEHMFVHPGHCHYYFGDYYASESCFPWHTYYHNHYCPLLTHYHWHHHRHGFNYLLHLHNFHHHMVGHAHKRPRRRFRHHRDSDRHGGQRRDESGRGKRRPGRDAEREVAANLGTSVEKYNKNIHKSKGVGQVQKRLVSDVTGDRQRRPGRGRRRRAESSTKVTEDGSPARTRRRSPSSKRPKATASRDPELKENATAGTTEADANPSPDRRRPAKQDRRKPARKRSKGSEDVATDKGSNDTSRPDVTNRSKKRTKSARSKNGPPERSSAPRPSVETSQDRSKRRDRTNPRSKSSRSKYGSTGTLGDRSDRDRKVERPRSNRKVERPRSNRKVERPRSNRKVERPRSNRKVERSRSNRKVERSRSNRKAERSRSGRRSRKKRD